MLAEEDEAGSHAAVFAKPDQEELAGCGALRCIGCRAHASTGMIAVRRLALTDLVRPIVTASSACTTHSSEGRGGQSLEKNRGAGTETLGPHQASGQAGSSVPGFGWPQWVYFFSILASYMVWRSSERWLTAKSSNVFVYSRHRSIRTRPGLPIER